MREIEYLVILTSCANFAGSLAYVWDTLRGRSQPNRVSFFLWAAAPFIGTAASLVQGVTWAALPVFMAGFGPFMIFLASFCNPKAKWKLGGFDWVCGVLSVAALVLWLVTKNPNVALFFSILSDAAATLPTLRKCWTHPETETIWNYVAGLFSAAAGLLVAEKLAFSEIAFPIYLLSADAALTGFMLAGLWRRRGLLTGGRGKEVG